MRVDDLRSFDLFTGLNDGQLRELIDVGTEVAIEPGSTGLFEEGKPADDWWVLVEGSVDLLRHFGREETVVGRLDVPGRWAGGFRAWDENGVYLATGRGAASGRLLRVPSTDLRALSSTWFPFAGHLLVGVYGTARRVESTVRQRQSLVTLGTLAAGLAHELNNPAAAATRSVDALEEACRTLLESLGRLAHGDISAAQFAELDELRRAVVPRSGPLDPLTVADDEELLTDWLNDHGVGRDWLIAPPLAAAGVDLEWCERAADVLQEGTLEPGLEWVASTLLVSTLLSEVRESTKRISELVAAVKSYSQMDRGAVQRIDVTEGLESTLTMLGHKLRGGITLVRDYGDVPEIEAYPGELNQVWTNLIDNAVDAMNGEGTLRISARADGEDVVVEVADTGAGMSQEVAARAFEAFYTTKDVGKGTGLGLDIARRIVVERHGGRIDIDSAPGSTVLQVRLPLRTPQS